MSETAPTPIPYLEPNKLYVGDCLSLLPRIEEGSVRLLLTDPPYQVSRPNNLTTMGRTGINFTWDAAFDHVGWLPLVEPLIARGGSVVIWDDWKKLGTLAAGLERLGFEVKRKLTWIKKNPWPRNRDRTFVQTHEDALWAVKKGRKWVFHRRPGSTFETGIFHYGIPRPGKGRLRHPAAKPPGLFKEIIEVLTNPGDLVLDPFAGGCPAVLAAQESGRKFICIEFDPTWAAKAPCEVVVEK